MVSLTGEVALVTGSGRGMGRAILQRLAELGADVAVHDVSNEAPAEFGEAKNLEDVANQLRTFGGRVCAVTGNIADESAVAAAVAKIERELGPVTVLVNCAGGDIAAKGGKPKPNDALGIPMEDVRAILDRNLLGTMIVTRAVAPKMAAMKKGSIVNIASAAAHYAVTVGVAYSVAKAAIIQYTKCLAMDLRAAGVRVNAVSPGPTKTARFLVTRPIDAKMADESVPLMRYGTPPEIADAVAYFASSGARFISGQVLRVDGGWALGAETQV